MKMWEVAWSGTSADADIGMLGQLLDAMGSTSFGSLLFQMIDEQAPIEMLACCTFESGHGINARWLEAKRPESKLLLQKQFDTYAKTYYLQDPIQEHLPRLFSVTPDAVPLILIHQMSAREIKDHEWRTHNYKLAALSDRVVMAALHPRFGVLTLGLLRHLTVGAFTPSELAWLSTMAPSLFRLLFKHEGIRFDGSPKANFPAIIGRLEQLKFGLTPREVQVCGYILQGASFEEIGKTLGVKHATVKTFRDRAFEKLKISSRFELFALLLG